MRLIIAVSVLVFFVGGTSYSQNRPEKPNDISAAAQEAANPQNSQSTLSEQKEKKEKKEDRQRIFGIFPAFNVSDQLHPEPLTKKQKFNLFARSTYDPVTLVVPLFKIPILQAVEGDNGFGPGFEGFAKRYGVSLADGTSSRFFRLFFFPSILKEDPRYFRRGHGSFGSRLRYSLSRLFVTNTDAERTRFNWSRLLGSAASSGLSNSYYPESQRGATTTLLNFALSYASEGGANLVKEFSQDISRKLQRKESQTQRQPHPASDAPAAW